MQYPPFLLRPYPKQITQAIVGGILVTVLGLASSIYVEKIVDYVIPNQNKNLLNILSVGMLVVLLVSFALGFLKSIIISKVGMLIDTRLILGYYKHLLKLPQSFFDHMRTGEILSRINDAVKIRSFINEVGISFIINMSIVIFSLLFMFSYYWKLGLVMLLIVPLYVLVYYFYNRANKKTERKIMEQAAELESHLVESINGVATIKRFGVEHFANHKTEFRFIAVLRSSYLSFRNSLWSSSVSDLLAKLFVVVLFWVGVGFVMKQEMTPGELLSFYSVLGYFTSPLGSLITMNKTLQNALISADRLFEIFDLEKEHEAEHPLALTKEKMGDIVFDKVYFKYGSRGMVLEDLNLCIRKGSITAIVGESGSGKSTLAHLLQGIYTLESGKILIGPIDIHYLDKQNLRQEVGVVPQQIDMFSDSLVGNIALGDMMPNMERVILLCQQVGIDDFIDSLPEGYYSTISENGNNLSGGQKQRIALARALYRDPSILILDEATSHLDMLAEQTILHCIQQLKQQGKTIILIAHRLSSISMADTIIVIDKGKVLQEGEHHRLIQEEGKYRELWRTLEN